MLNSCKRTQNQSTQWIRMCARVIEKWANYIALHISLLIEYKCEINTLFGHQRVSVVLALNGILFGEAQTICGNKLTDLFCWQILSTRNEWNGWNIYVSKQWIFAIIRIKWASLQYANWTTRRERKKNRFESVAKALIYSWTDYKLRWAKIR